MLGFGLANARVARPSPTVTVEQPAAQFVSAAPGDRSQSPVAQNSRSAGKPYFIEFRARQALSYGHTFAVIARVGEKLTRHHVHGLHPATESSVPWMIGHLIPVVSETGWSDGDIEDQYITAKYRIYLTAAEYKKLMEQVGALKASSPVWHAVLYNCNAFVADIAKGMGLLTPRSTLLLPKEYITELKALNNGSNNRRRTPLPDNM
jgi:hypothetical protein